MRFTTLERPFHAVRLIQTVRLLRLDRERHIRVFGETESD
ncbi:hypothetical protein SDC9_200918 [bioreactor metagenome]|uniref:Uncharacterized protein n=1 Tax=bioreactor metagenome TaxID=1076179 RepID=A0A645IY05_9ZZZZ